MRSRLPPALVALTVFALLAVATDRGLPPRPCDPAPPVNDSGARCDLVGELGFTRDLELGPTGDLWARNSDGNVSRLEPTAPANEEGCAFQVIVTYTGVDDFDVDDLGAVHLLRPNSLQRIEPDGTVSADCEPSFGDMLAVTPDGETAWVGGDSTDDFLVVTLDDCTITPWTAPVGFIAPLDTDGELLLGQHYPSSTVIAVDLATATVAATFGGGEAPNQLCGVADIALVGDFVEIADVSCGRILQYDRTGALYRSFDPAQKLPALDSFGAAPEGAAGLAAREAIGRYAVFDSAFANDGCDPSPEVVYRIDSLD